MMKLFVVRTSLLLAFSCCSVAHAADSISWNRFRGPNGSGVANSFEPPVKFAAEGAAWKTAIFRGHSSPVVSAGWIFFTGFENRRLTTVAIDSRSGDVLWKQPAPRVQFERTHATSSPAVPTPCADAENVYVYFGSFGLLCYGHDGDEKWKKRIPLPKSMYGTSSSPIVHGDLVILVLDDDANLDGSKLSRSKVIALKKATGEVVWETPRPYNRSGWSTPMTWTHGEVTDLVVLGNGRVYGYDPATGEERWFVKGFSRETIAVPVAGVGQLFVSVAMQGGRGDVELDPEPFWKAALLFDKDGDKRIARTEISDQFTVPFRPELPLGHPGFGFPLPKDPAKRKARQSGLFSWRDTNRDGFWTEEEFKADMAVGRGQPNLAAIRPGGRGDVTGSHVNWNLRNGIPEIPSPIFHKDRLYLVRDGGLLSCVRTDSGKTVYRERLGASGHYNASPVIANDRLYLVSSRGVVTVVKTGDEFAVEHQTDLKVKVVATPAIDKDSLYIRTANSLMAFRRSD
jgi:outer membrane protein assembly factor BamB